MSRIALFSLLVAAVAAPAVAKETKPVDPDKKVCRRMQATGSIMTKKVCHTRAEWAQIDGVNEEAVRRARDKVSTGLRPGD